MSFVNKFCSNLIVVDWKVGDLVTGNRGFKLYYEIFDTASLANCPKDPLVISTTPAGLTSTTKKPADLINQEASATYDFQVNVDKNGFSNFM